jgi:hypothetical protein
MSSAQNLLMDWKSSISFIGFAMRLDQEKLGPVIERADAWLWLVIICCLVLFVGHVFAGL